MEGQVKIVSLVKAISLLMFFLTFAINFLLLNSMILEAFIRGLISYFVSALITSILVLLWRFAFPDREWKSILEASSIHLQKAENDSEFKTSQVA